MNYSLFVAFLITISVVQCRLVSTPVSIQTSVSPDIEWTIGTGSLGIGITNYFYVAEDFNAVGIFADGGSFLTTLNKRGSLFETPFVADDNVFAEGSFFFSTKYPVARYIKTYDGNAFGGGVFNEDFYVAIEESNIVTTSSGDDVFDVSDNWFIIRTDDNGVFVFLEPYERRSVMFFSYLAGTLVEAQAAVSLFS